MIGSLTALRREARSWTVSALTVSALTVAAEGQGHDAMAFARRHSLWLEQDGVLDDRAIAMDRPALTDHVG